MRLSRFCSRRGINQDEPTYIVVDNDGEKEKVDIVHDKESIKMSLKVISSSG